MYMFTLYVDKADPRTASRRSIAQESPAWTTSYGDIKKPK